MWQFWIDVGGTFTDCVARSPAGEIQVSKVLSTGLIKARVTRFLGGRLELVELEKHPAGFFDGYSLTAAGSEYGWPHRILRSGGGWIATDPVPSAAMTGRTVEITAHEPAPVLAIRLTLGLGLDADPGPLIIRLGTTRATNALLERRGARTAFVTTAGFGDVLRIANQDRPALFDLDIRKPASLFEEVLELPERVTAEGQILQSLDPDLVRRELTALRERGIDSLAVCLLHAYRKNVHEECVREAAQGLGFARVALSSRLAPTIKIVSRGDTTVVDAYLTPVVRDAVRKLTERLPRARLKLMTSAGGLVAPAAFTGKDTLLSGPAGGVVGFAGVARAAGIDKAIGFDMGGTSTDVSRFDDGFTYEYEAVKAGARIVAPMLAIETVAAGGGSICHFDGQKLGVGPASAGADPGPACYGRGGPLTVTDLNFRLGRLHGTGFPFPLDPDALDARLDRLCEEIEQATGARPEPAELAAGLLRIANGNMAAAIRRISLARGYDTRDYTLISFGGAAGQHTCAVARELGMRRILIHRHAGVLSAYGMGLADVRKFAVRTVMTEYEEDALEALEPIYRMLEQQLRSEMGNEDVAPAHIEAPRRRLDLRYRGQGSSLTVAGSAGQTYAEAFEALHRQVYGHAFEGRPIEIVAARVELVGAMDKPEDPEIAPGRGEPVPRGQTRVWVDEAWAPCPVYHRSDLGAGHVVPAPALILEATSATWLEPGWECSVEPRGELLLRDGGAARSPARASTRADPVLLEVFHNRFASIAEEMGVTLRRTALSVNVKERLDYSCAVFTAEGDLVANAPHMPVHLGAMSECVKRVLADMPELEPGDVVATNDPLRGGSHLPDITVVTPVFDASGERLLFFTASRAHHAEIGGTRPGSMPADSHNLAEEGVLIRNLRVVEAGRERLDRLRELLTAAPYPSRAPDENVADVSAQIAANQTGVAALRVLIEEFGRPVTLAYMKHIQRAAERKTRAALARLGNGEYRFEDRLDAGAVIRVRIDIRDGEAVVDFTGSSPVLSGNLNANRAIVSAAVIYCFRCLIDEEIPLNAGVLAPVTLRVPEGLLNPPEHDDPRECAAVAGGNVETSQRVVDVLLGALGLVAASQGTMNNLTFGDARFGYYETICGGAGAGPGFPGADAVHTHMTNTRLTDPEVLENQYPVRLRRFEIRRGSGGEGRYRGGDGARREIEFRVPLEFSMLSQRRSTRPYGLAGGGPGLAGRNRLIRASGEIVELPGICHGRVEPGDRLLIETPGGGGYGTPEQESEKKDGMSSINRD